MNNNEKVIISFLVGAAAGALAGLLLAPATGDETREKLKDNALRVSDDLRKQAEKAMDSFDSARNSAESYLNDIQGKMSSSDLAGKAEDLKNKAKA